MNKYYEMPLRFDQLMTRNQELPACKLQRSIEQNIFLIISCKYNEHRFDPAYGCEIWDRDFELITNPLVWQEQINKSIHSALNRYELRLERITVDTAITEVPYVHPATRVHSIKKKVIVRINGIMKGTGQQFSFTPQLFLSPISLD